MKLHRLNNGERLAGVSAIFLFVSMFFHWFAVKAMNTSSLLFAVQSTEPGKNAWQALEYIPFFLVVTIVVTLVVTALRLTGILQKEFAAAVSMMITILGFVSVLLIVFQMVDPPVFYVEATVTYEGASQPPIFLALLAAAGIAIGSYLAMREQG